MDVIVYLVGGLALLVVGGEAVVRGSVSAARTLGVSELLIGLTLVGFGTSTPELLTSLNAALAGSPGISVGNVVGSNIANILLILGIVAALRPVMADPAAIRRDGTMGVIAAILVVGSVSLLGAFPRWVGIAFILVLAAYLVTAWRAEQAGGPAAALHEDEAKALVPGQSPLWRSLLTAIVGIALLILGADLLVDGSIQLARGLGVSETLIGLTIVAVGTSLPELVASLASALKGRSDIALGNVLGSNIYNVFGILGITAMVSPIAVPPELGWLDLTAMTAAAVLLMVHATTGGRVSRWEGVSLVALYVVYAVLLTLRG